MAATPLSPGHERELAALRARAYGPDADISLDPRELARLNELEVMARPDAAPSASAEPVQTEDGSTAGVSASVVVEDSLAAAATGASADTASISAPTSWWRRVPVSTLVAGAAVLGLGIGLAAPGLLPPHPYAVLSAAPSEGRGPSFATYGDRLGWPTRYENFHDLEVWSARTAEGSACVLVISADTTWRQAGCAPRPFDPVADIYPYPVIRAIDGLELPIGSLVRFILHDGAVQVWIDRNAEQT